jgi:hypothetical protein
MGKKCRSSNPAAAVRTILLYAVLRFVNADIESNYCHFDPVCDFIFLMLLAPRIWLGHKKKTVAWTARFIISKWP